MSEDERNAFNTLQGHKSVEAEILSRDGHTAMPWPVMHIAVVMAEAV